jgi:hypothetical protein
MLPQRRLVSSFKRGIALSSFVGLRMLGMIFATAS